MVDSKCGGANPNNFPYVDNLVLFSEENSEWFRTKSKFSKTNIHVISNRVKQVKKHIVPHLKDFADSFTFMRIARIGNSYKKSIDDSVRLVKELNKTHREGVRLIIVGTIQDQEVYSELRRTIDNDPSIMLLVDDNYT